MKNLKFSFLLLLLVSLFACNTQQIAEDETPLEVTSSLLILDEQGEGPIDTTPVAKMYISVEYGLSLLTRDEFRTQFQELLNIHSWYTCRIRQNVEVWEIDFIAERDFEDVIQSIGDFTVTPPGSAASGGGDSTWAGTQYLLIGNIFHIEDICY